MNQRIGIIGASGWIGRHLTTALEKKGHTVIGFSRSAREGWRQWDTCSVPDLSGLDAVINLAGEAVDQRWTDSNKKAFRESRVNLTNFLVEGIAGTEVKVLLNASGVGFYGSCGDEILTEKTPAGSGYLAQLCVDWEDAAAQAPCRSVFLRTGVALGEGSRAWKKLKAVFSLGVGGRLGDGCQWMPWIHLADELGAIIHCLENEISGPINLAAPECVTNQEFTKILAKALKRPALFPAPAFALRLALGEFADEGLLASLRVKPELLLESGYQFQFPDLAVAIADLLNQ